MSSEEFKKLCKDGDKILSNIQKSYKRGFSEGVKVKYANSIIDLVNNFITHARTSTEHKDIYHKEWGTFIYGNAAKAFKQLRVDIEVPKELPELPLQKIGSLEAHVESDSVNSDNREDEKDDSENQQANSSFADLTVVDTSTDNVAKPKITLLPARFGVKMANFDFSVGLRLDELSSTRAADISSFIDLVTCYHDTLSSEARKELIRFLVAAKIKKEAKVRLGSEKPTTLEELKGVLFGKVLAAETEEEILAKLQTARQGRRSLAEFTNYLSDLAERLAAAMGRKYTDPSGIQRQTVQETCKKLALAQFKTSCHEEVKLVVAAARPNTLEEALTVATASNFDVPSFNVHLAQRFQNNKYRQNQHNNRNSWNRDNGNHQHGSRNWNRDNGNYQHRNRNWNRDNGNHQYGNGNGNRDNGNHQQGNRKWNRSNNNTQHGNWNNYQNQNQRRHNQSHNEQRNYSQRTNMINESGEHQQQPQQNGNVFSVREN